MCENRGATQNSPPSEPSMPIIPPFALAIVIAYLQPLLHWLSDQTYTELLQRAPDHLLIKLAKLLNFTPLESACAAYHHTEGPGSTPTHPVPRLVRALLVKYLYHSTRGDPDWHLRLNLAAQ